MTAIEINNAAKHVVNNYIKTQNPGYALLIDAPWGAGKTHFIKNETNYETDNTILYVSLNGITNADEFDWSIVKAIKPFSNEKIGRFGEQLKSFVSGIQIMGCSVDLNQVQITEIVLSNIPDILIFDDLERCMMEHDQLSGLLNRFIEHEGRRVILLANIDKHNNPENFNTKSEKLIGRTIHIQAEAETAILTFWSQIKDSQGKKFIKSIQSEMLVIFNEASSNNLRILRQALNETCDFINKVNKDFFSNKASLTLLATTYFAIAMAFRNGELNILDLEKRGDYSTFSKKESDNPSNLEILQARHQKCDIQGYHNSCLPVNLAISSIGRGFAAKEQINKELAGIYHFAKPEQTPDWIRLWNWHDEDLNELPELLKRVNTRLHGNELIPAGEVLQIYGAKIHMRRFDAIKISEKELNEEFKAIIKKLTKKQLITSYEPKSSLQDGYGYSIRTGNISYGGFGFEITESSSKILNEMQLAQKSLFNEKLPEYAKDLLQDLQADPVNFVKKLNYHTSDISFSETSILHLISETDFANALLKLYTEDREVTRGICDKLKIRRGTINKELELEQEWFEKLETELLNLADKQSSLFKAQISVLISWNLK